MGKFSKKHAALRESLAKARDAKISKKTEISNHVAKKQPFTERPPEILESQLRSGAEKQKRSKQTIKSPRKPPKTPPSENITLRRSKRQK